jgi:hypothetical protein
MPELVISLAGNGAVEALHDDRFPLKDIGAGAVKMERASLIEWDEMAQHWNVRLPAQTKPYYSCQGFPSYEAARTFEVEWLNACLLVGADPASDHGLQIAIGVRSQEA